MDRDRSASKHTRLPRYDTALPAVAEELARHFVCPSCSSNVPYSDQTFGAELTLELQPDGRPATRESYYCPPCDQVFYDLHPVLTNQESRQHEDRRNTDGTR